MLDIDGPRDCSGPVRMSGQIRISDGPRRIRVRRMLMSVHGARVIDASAKLLGGRRVHLRTIHYRGSTLLVTESAGLSDDEPLVLDMHVDVARRGSFGACYVDTPQLLEDSTDTESFAPAQDGAVDWAQKHAKPFEVMNALFPEAVITTRVNGMIPDRSSLVSDSVVRRNAVLAICDSRVPEADSADTRADEFYYVLKTFAKRGCGELQRFQVIGAAEALNRRVFLGGLLLSTALAILLEAAFIGRVEGLRE